ncbi:hypothetical protein NUW58_g1377 [Xylaria curta]|uniref:Uncharacterized protein n=1 Tax=Xylaria curta TaxID=42375 RepID=A0ACC1PNE4_9PEZI|nr:hypothetical protein NUW58_g1377 [Xylaria curta]
MGSYHHSCFRRPVFSPTTPESLAAGDISETSISSLPDLIRFNALENPNRIFALQSELHEETHRRSEGVEYGVSRITFKQLDEMVGGCARWISKNVISTDRDSELSEQTPIAIYMESGLGLFIHLAALLSLDVPALLVSARLGCPSVLHLLRKTDAKTILVSRRTGSSLSENIHDSARVMKVERYSTFMSYTSQIGEIEEMPRNESRCNDNSQQHALILHSSGTTGLYILGYAACHQFPADEEIDWINLSTLPLYHGFGLLAPCLSLSIGMTVCFPPPSIIPATRSTLDLIRTFECRSLMTVPSIIDDILCQSNESEKGEASALLTKLEFLAVGGGALKPEQGAILAENDVKLLNHYGVTEIGAIAPIFRPKSDYNWRFLRLRSDLGLELHPIPDSTHFRLVGYPIGWGKPFEVQDELERNDASSHVEVRILGRTDDVIVLKTGEKVQPRQLEDALNADPAIRTAVCVGSGFFELAVIIDPISEDSDATIKDQVWRLLSAINPSVDHHARITSKEAIIVKPPGKLIPRSDKGSIMRRDVHEIFKQEINDAYAAMELDSLGESFILDPANIEMGIRHLITTVTSNRLDGEHMTTEEDLFESGMDSLQTVLFSRLLGSCLRKLAEENGRPLLQISTDFIYRNPSIKRLAAESARLINPEGDMRTDVDDNRAKEMKNLADEYIASLSRQMTSYPIKHTILITGSTGSLGAHALAKLTRIESIEKIICLVRGQPLVTNGASLTSNSEKAESILQRRQRSALEAAGICLGPKEWAKIELLELASVVGEYEASKAQLSYLSGRITHILHLAWPMDFHRRLESFRPHIKLLQTLVDLAQLSSATRQATEPIRLIFTSSIAVVRYYSERGDKSEGHFGSIVPESTMPDPLATVPMGYAEAKWVCETYLDNVAKRFPGIEPVVIRVGQLSGPERTRGMWKTEEHIPVLVRASQTIGAFPQLDGLASWMPVDRAASCLSEILMRGGKVDNFLHLENPVRQPLKDIFTIMAHEMGLSRPFVIPFEKWLQRVTVTGEVGSLGSFLTDHFDELAGGAVTLDTAKARALSNRLAGSSALDKELIVDYLKRWQHDGFLNNTTVS